jgi:hypothetical protein
MTAPDVPVFLRHDNPRKQGDAGMGVAIGWFACAGYTVCVPLTDSQGYDLIVDDGEHGLQRVSVKTTTRKTRLGRAKDQSGSAYVVGLRTQGGNRSQFKVRHFNHLGIELLFVACDNGDRYLIPTGEFSEFSELTLGKRFDKFKI